MQGALSAGAYGDNDHDSLGTTGGTSTDFYRHWPAGQDGQESRYFMEGTGAAAGRWINLYNDVDPRAVQKLHSPISHPKKRGPLCRCDAVGDIVSPQHTLCLGSNQRRARDWRSGNEGLPSLEVV